MHLIAQLHTLCSLFVKSGVLLQRIDSPRNKRSQNTRAAILDATLRLFEETGSEGITMAAVAEAAGVSRRGLYLHFATRAQLVMALFDHVDERFDLASSIRPMQEAPDAVTALRAWARHVASYHHRLGPLTAAAERVAQEDPDVRSLSDHARGVWYDACRRLAGALASEGRLDAAWTPDTAADLLWSLMSPQHVVDLVDLRGWTVDELGERLALVVERTLVAPGTGAPARD